MKKGKLTGIGIGPGDPELITVKAQRILKEAEYIAIPNSMNKKSTAKSIIDKIIDLKSKTLIDLEFPMTYDENKLNEKWNDAITKIRKFLDSGKDVVFVTLGDVSVYSTFMYVNKIIKKLDYNIEIIPGITSFSASAAVLNMSLGENNDKIAVVPNIDNEKTFVKILKTFECIIFMKPTRYYNKIIRILKENNLYKNACLISNCSNEKQEIVWDLDKFKAVDVSYFSIIIVRK